MAKAWIELPEPEVAPVIEWTISITCKEPENIIGAWYGYEITGQSLVDPKRQFKKVSEHVSALKAETREQAEKYATKMSDAYRTWLGHQNEKDTYKVSL